MKALSATFIILCSFTLSAQGPGSAFNPATAPGAKGIHWTAHILYWENPAATIYNEVYFSHDSSAVANLDTNVRVLNGFPSTTHNSFPLSSYGNLNMNTNYFWRVVEFDGSESSVSPLWHFTSQPSPIYTYEYNFTSNFDGWVIKGPLGLNNWTRPSTSIAGGSPGEIRFAWNPVFWGDSYIMSPEIPSPAYVSLWLSFRYYLDWWADTCIVGCAYTTDDGSTWTTVWDLHATGNVGPEQVNLEIVVPGNFRLGFFYTGNSDNIDFLYIDDVIVRTVLTPSHPPSFLNVLSHYDEQKVTLNWNSGWSPYNITGYYIQRKTGLPSSTTEYLTLNTASPDSFIYEDHTVELTQVYTYRILTISGPGMSSHFGNEATAYVPEVVPVELASFNASVKGNNVLLNWMTASEINNFGFEIERASSKTSPIQSWENIGFVEGKGTITGVSNYSFVDKELVAGLYNYRLKQMDVDGTFKYFFLSELIEIGAPDKFELAQNYPNPFNPSTVIVYQMPVSGQVTLKVYDILGKEVAVLVDEYMPAGNYHIEFNASNLSAGVYMYELVSGNFSETKKLVLLK